ncbi:MAG: bifunctional aconitate hydratase 2/2-methylisocitrate dehydratase [Proteobacteria bacterium]|nr:bifunctional aconitate hydratase 2/2-methylisocitrate dehydratase [Pseudomonadota bacterium]
MLNDYLNHVEQRKSQGLVPQVLTQSQVESLAALIASPPSGHEALIKDLLVNRVPPGVDPAAAVKADILEKIALGQMASPLIDKTYAIQLLGTMLGGYNIRPLVNFLDMDDLAPMAAQALSNTLLVFDAFQDIFKRYSNNPHAKKVVDNWASATWFTGREKLPEKITMTVFKVDGEINTDDLSPASEAWSRPDIPLHAKSMLISRMEHPIESIIELKKKGYPIVFVGDVVGTGSSRKSATNSVLWHVGYDIPHVPNKKQGGIVLGGKIAPIFFNTLEDAGSLPIECDVSQIHMGDLISIYPYKGTIVNESTGQTVSTFTLKTDVLLDEVQAGGRIPLIIGRSLSERAREALGLKPSEVFRLPPSPGDKGKGFTLAQKMVGQACGLSGVRPGAYCEPVMKTVGSQDTTGPMTRDELKELACLDFSADLVMQSFCHTAAYPRRIDIEMHQSMPDFFGERGGVVLKPGDGVIHPWLNRMVLPDTVGTGGDSHTRFPIGISFPAGSGLVAFAAAMGIMPLDMPESVLVRFKGTLQPGITLRDLVNAIPYVAIQKNLLTVAKEGKKNIFSGRILEIEGLENITVEQAFEFSDASAERSAAACTFNLGIEPVSEYLKSNVALLKDLLNKGYRTDSTLERRIAAMEAWIKKPTLLKADPNGDYAEIIEIDLDQITEPILACPNDPDDVKLLSELSGTSVDEVFIGSCMTNIGHFRAAARIVEHHGKELPVKLWVVPPTRMDADRLKEEGVYSTFGRAGARIEIPGCSLCMGNQARVKPGCTVVSTSTRNFPNRMGDKANVFLASAELAAMTAVLGKLPSLSEYMATMKDLDSAKSDIYRYLEFHKN